MTYIPLALLAIIQAWLLIRSKKSTPGRKAVRATLNALLLLVLAGFVYQPTWPSRVDSAHVLLVDNEVPSAVARTVQDSLGIRERVTANTIRPDKLDSITMLGQNFPATLLPRLHGQVLRWVPFTTPGKPIGLHWKTIVRVGEEQRISGVVRTDELQKLTVRFGRQVLDSLWLKPGQQAFALRFPAPAKGRTETVLWLGNEPLDTVRFYGQGVRTLNIQFVLSTPDFETKTLANWLGRQGHRVELTSTLSTGIDASLQINTAAKTSKEKNVIPDLVVTEPGLVGGQTIRKALTAGKSVLVVNLTNPPTETGELNRSLGTSWRFQKTSNEPTVPAGNGLTALPYRFAASPNQFAVQGAPIAVQAVGGRVAVSLLTETFPLKLSGDSLAYARIWNAVLAKLQPVQTNSISVEGPVLVGNRTSITVNTPSASPATQSRAVTASQSTSAMPAFTPSTLNPQTFSTRYRFARSGWQPIADSLEVFVEDSLSHPDDRMSQWMLAHNRYQKATARVSPVQESRIPDWVWLTLLLSCLTALWVEPKL